MTNTNRQRYEQSSSITETLGSLYKSQNNWGSYSEYQEMSVAGKPLYYVSLGASARGGSRNETRNFDCYSSVTAYAILDDGTEVTLGSCSQHSNHNVLSTSKTIIFTDKLTPEQMSRVVKVKGYFYGKSGYTYDEGHEGSSDGGKSGSLSVVAWYGSWGNE